MGDERNRKLRIYLNTSRKDKIPADASEFEWRKFHAAWRPVTLTARQMAIEVWRGHSVAHLHDGRKTRAQWVEGAYLALDFDTGDERSGLEYLAEQDLINTFASFAYTTPSHTEEEPRARVVWVFDKPATDLKEYETLYRAMLAEFPWADQSTKDATRFFYGSAGCTVWDNWSVFPGPSWRYVMDRWKAEKPKPTIDDQVSIDPGDVAPEYLELVVEKILHEVKTAPDGEKHKRLNKSAYTLGGYVGGGYLQEHEVKATLHSIVKGLNNVRNENKAYKTIDDAMAAGKAEPLAITRDAEVGEK